VSALTRRQFAAQTLMVACLRRATLAAGPSYRQDLPDMLVSYLARKVNSLAEHWDGERIKIKTAAEIEVRNRFVRAKAIEMIHGLPDRTPLDPIIVNRFERDGYRIETLMFQSRPNFWVPASLYVPTVGGGPFPGIISPCGHSANGRLYPAYQYMYTNLVKSSFVVLAYDPVGQGERRQYWNPQTNTNDLGGPTTWEHSFSGQLLLLLGEDLTHYRVWDGMRAIDYLLTRPEVDAERIGCAGQSGGGTFTLFISALDERVRCAAVHQGGTSHRWPLEIRPETHLSTGDTEQHMFPAAIYGVDLCDLHVAIAPRPLLATIEHYSPRFNKVAEHVRQRYKEMGVPERFATEEATDPHGMTVKLRQATTDWFCRWFFDRRGPASEPELQLEPPAKMYCTPGGSIRYSHHGETIFSLILKKQAQLPPGRKLPTTTRELEAFRREIQSQVRKLLHLPNGTMPLAPRHVITTPRKGYEIEKLEFLSEPGIYIPTWVFKPERRADAPAILYVNETGTRRDGMEFGPLEKLARKGRLVVAVEVRGIGETTPPHPGDFSRSEFGHVDDVETVLSYLAWEINESLFGMRVHDVLRSVDYVLSRTDIDRSGVRAIGKDMGALWLLFAAALDSRIRVLVAENGLLSYRALTRVDRYLHGANVFIIDVLKYFDLPQVAAAIADRPVTLLAPVDHLKQPVGIATAREEYEWTQQVYSNCDAAGHFRIVAPRPDVDAVDQYLELMKEHKQ
jgi:cephalosporin-C deacetylase-like acetyl esterase